LNATVQLVGHELSTGAATKAAESLMVRDSRCGMWSPLWNLFRCRRGKRIHSPQAACV